MEQTEQVEQVETEKRLVRAKTLGVTETGSIALQSLEDQMAFGKKLIDEKMISDTFRSPQQVVIGIQYAKAMGLEVITALKMMYVINGKPSLYGEGPLALCKRSGQVTRHREFFYDADHVEICFANKNTNAKVYGACSQIWRKGDDLCQEDYFTVDDMARAGLDRNKWGKKEVWEKWERIMLRYKARTMGLRSKFPDLIAGVPIAEYDDHFSPETPEVNHARSEIADELNERFLGAREVENGEGSA